MLVDDVKNVAEVEKESFSMPWSESAFLESLSYDHTVFLVAEDIENSEILGYVGMYKVFNEADITNIAVRQKHRGKKIGERLMKEIKEYATKCSVSDIMLEVRESNEIAISLYEKMGFEKAGMRKNFYEKPAEDAIVMICRMETV